jgi:hypothetical protein
MHKTPKHIYEEIVKERPFCERQEYFHDHDCRGRSTMEHALIFRGSQLTEKWSIIRLCYWSHLGPGLNKRINEWIALNHATKQDLKKYKNAGWEQKLKYLNKIYGAVYKTNRGTAKRNS